MSHTLSYLKNYKFYLTVGPFFKLLEAIFELIVPLVMADLIDNGINNPSATLSFILGRGGIMLALGLIGFGCAYICQYVASKCSQGYGTDLRAALYEHINKLSFEHLDKFGASGLVTRMTSDINQMQIAIAMLIRLVIRAPFLVIGSAVMAIIINPLLGIIFAVVAPLIGLCLYFVMSKSVPHYRKIQKNLDTTNRITSENLNGIRVIRAFSNQENQIEKFKKNNAQMRASNIKVGIISALLSPLTFAIVNIATAAVLFFGGKLVSSGGMTQGEIIAFINYLLQIALAIIVTSSIVSIYTRSYASVKRIEEVLKTPADERAQTEATETDPSCAVTFSNVDFAYSSKSVLSAINFDIKTGQTVGIIGGTGSGKSTLANIICGLYSIKSGQVTLGGVDISLFPPSQLASKISFCEQNATIFSGTIRSNMLFGKSNATDDDIICALKIAQAYEFVSTMEGGLDAEIRQNGKNLSGGQKQRLSIARAIIKMPQILILDDSTSALDYLTEAKLFSALNSKLSSCATKIIISQRINSLKKCDKILVLDAGKLEACGSHKDLLATSSVYKEIWLSQQKEGQK